MRLPRPIRLTAVILTAAISMATSVLPPTFDELVAQSEYVVRATVVAMHCEWRTTEESRFIVTMVSVRVDEAVVGRVPTTLELEFVGGTIDGRSIHIAGQPEFRVGDEDILFIAGNGKQVCPLVGMMYGRYLIAKDDTGQKLIARSNGVLVTALAEVAVPLAEGPPATILQRAKQNQGLTVAAFCDAIRESARRQGRTDTASP